MVKSNFMTPTLPTVKELEEMLFKRLNLPPNEKEAFLSPHYNLGNLWDFTDMQIAVERLAQAISNEEQIGIYADYDCDGIPGAVVLIDFFKKIGMIDRVHVYIPDRHDEGYGIKINGIEELKKFEVSLIITVDVGVTAIEEIAFAQNLGIDVILTDHHEPLKEWPQALAVIHPKKGNYINQDPCGAAVAFYLVCAFLEKYQDQFQIPVGWEKWLLDLVGFATLSDMVPLTDGNRVLAFYGLLVMRQTKRIGLKILLEKNGIALPYLTESDLTFTVAPRLNAASRMASPMLAFELMASTDRVRAEAIVKELDLINTERKTLVATITKSATVSVADRNNLVSNKIVVVGNPHWRPAVLGLVANKLVEKYNQSFFVWGEAGDGSIKGSCRMISEHHAALLFQALPEGLVLHAGGHQAAGGFSVSKEKIHLLEEGLNQALAKISYMPHISEEEDLIVLPLGCISARYLAVVRRFAPFGVGNPEPEFVFEDVEVIKTKMFGKNKEHLECQIKDATGSATAFTFFVSAEFLQKIVAGAKVSLSGNIESGWRGGVRIRIKKIL